MTTKENTDKLDTQTETLLGLHTVRNLHYSEGRNTVYFYRCLNILHLDHADHAAQGETILFKYDF
jgi:hypothetical protein